MNGMLKTVLIGLAAAVVLWELRALYRSWVAYSRSELEKIHQLPIAERPNRRGHFIGNLVRFFSRR